MNDATDGQVLLWPSANIYSFMHMFVYSFYL